MLRRVDLDMCRRENRRCIGADSRAEQMFRNDFVADQFSIQIDTVLVLEILCRTKNKSFHVSIDDSSERACDSSPLTIMFPSIPYTS